MPVKIWTEPAVNHLRMRWADGAAPVIIASELTVLFGHTYTSASVSTKASNLKLGSRHGLDCMGDAGADQTRMRRSGMTERQIANVRGESYSRVNNRARVMIAYGLVDRHPLRLPAVPVDDGIPETLGMRLRRLRLAKGLTQRAVADLIECRPDAVARWEGGAAPPTSRQERLAAVLGVSRDMLMTGREHPLLRAIRVTRR